MEDTTQETNGAGQSPKPASIATISERKLKANRENAKKSTGPRTPRGKAYSRRNAIKHGLFARQSADFIMPEEAQHSYDQLVEDLWKECEPVGRTEELEVERIAVCWWRLKRAWQYENCKNHVLSIGTSKLERTEGHKALDEKEDTILLELQSIEKEMRTTNQAPKDLKQRFLALTSDPELWEMLETTAKEIVNRESNTWSNDMIARAVTYQTLHTAIAHFQLKRECRDSNGLQDTFGERLIPDHEALDTLLRYETAIERSLGRALDRLERLQRRRKGEPVLPPVSVRLT